MTNAEAYRMLRFYLVVYLQEQGVWSPQAPMLNGPEEGKAWPRSEMRERAKPVPPSDFAVEQLRHKGQWEDRVRSQMEPYIGTEYRDSGSLFERRERYHAAEINGLGKRFEAVAVSSTIRWAPIHYWDETTALFKEEYFQTLRNTGRCTNRELFEETTPQLELPSLSPDRRAALEDLLDRMGTHKAHLEAIRRLRHHFDGHDIFEHLPMRKAGSIAEAADYVMERYAERSRIARKELVRQAFEVEGYGPVNKRDFDKALDKAFATREPKYGVTREGTPVPSDDGNGSPPKGGNERA